jgi:DNA-binding MarR family transcriptional regulator
MAIDQFTRSLPMMLYRTLDTVMPRFRSIFNEFGLTEQQWRVLRVLWETDHDHGVI